MISKPIRGHYVNDNKLESKREFTSKMVANKAVFTGQDGATGVIYS